MTPRESGVDAAAGPGGEELWQQRTHPIPAERDRHHDARVAGPDPLACGVPADASSINIGTARTRR